MDEYLLKDGVWFFTANLYEEDLGLFRGQWPLPQGLSVNAFLIRGERTALIGIPGHPEARSQILDQFADAGIEPRIDFAVLVEYEPGQGEFLERLKSLNPALEVVGTAMAVEALRSEVSGLAFRILREDDRLDLGLGRSLKFLVPALKCLEDGLAVLEESQGVLFSGALAAGFGALEEAETDETLSGGEKDFFRSEAFRYYTNVLGEESGAVRAVLERWKVEAPWKILAPAHGPLWISDPMGPVRDLESWSQEAATGRAGTVTVIRSSTSDADDLIADELIRGAQSRNTEVHLFRYPEDHPGVILPAVYRSSGLILGLEAEGDGLAPSWKHLLGLILRRGLSDRAALRFGSRWSSGAERDWGSLRTVEDWGWEWGPGVEVGEGAYEAGARLGSG